MGPIKFRVYDTVNKRYISDTSDFWINPSFTAMIDGGHAVYGQIVFEINDSLVFQQSTNIKDKLGVEIYEGDVLRTKYTGSSPYIPESHRDLRIVRRHPNDNNLYLFSVKSYDCMASGYQLRVTTNNRFEVIGNVYDKAYFGY